MRKRRKHKKQNQNKSHRSYRLPNLLKTEDKATRIKHGNRTGDLIVEYLNHRYDAGLASTDGNFRDTIDGIDCMSADFSGQIKWRQAGRDAIYAFQRFNGKQYKGKNPVLSAGWESVPDRDARSKAHFNIVGGGTLPHLALVPSEQIKQVLQQIFKEWGVPFHTEPDPRNQVECYLIDVPDAKISEWYKQAAKTDNKCTQLFSSTIFPAPVIKFKIEEGEQNRVFGKLIMFCPPEICQAKYIKLCPDEAVLNPDTWHKPSGESFASLIKLGEKE